MAEGGTLKNRIEELDRLLEEEQALWDDEVGPEHPPDSVWMFGHLQLHANLRIDSIVEILEKHLGVSEDQMNLIYKTKRLEMMRKMRPAVADAKRKELQSKIIDGIFIKPPPDVSGN